MDSQISIDISGEYDKQDIALCHQIMNVLKWHYPDHPWMVNANHKTGVADIKLCYLSRKGALTPYGFMFHIGEMQNGEFRRKIMRGGGELLERYGLPRVSATADSELLHQEHGIEKIGAK